VDNPVPANPANDMSFIKSLRAGYFFVILIHSDMDPYFTSRRPLASSHLRQASGHDDSVSFDRPSPYPCPPD
jgi:hypothetical protein